MQIKNRLILDLGLCPNLFKDIKPQSLQQQICCMTEGDAKQVNSLLL